MKPLLIILLTIVFCCLLGLSTAGSLYAITVLPGQFDQSELRDANPPADLSVSVSSGMVLLSWTDVANAISYIVEASGNPTESFTDVSTGGTFGSLDATRSWQCPETAAYQFYRVKTVSASIPDSFVAVGGGTFHNGASWVSVSSFYMDKYELTQGAYLAVMGALPPLGNGAGTNMPIYYVSWFNAIAYCNKRSVNEGLTPCYAMAGYGSNVDTWPDNWFNNYPSDSSITCDWAANGYRLPTEAEWEFAARGGSLSQSYTYSGSNDLGLVAWRTFSYPPTTIPVGSLAANELGLYDMTGNVAEHCWDVMDNYPTIEQLNPHGPGGTGNHIIRGGGFWSSPEQCAVSYRTSGLPHLLNSTIGFRICRKP